LFDVYVFKQSSICLLYRFYYLLGNHYNLYLYSNIILDCGRVFIQNQVLIENGEKALVGTAPWNVGIYQLNKKKYNYDMICGGSIIAPNLVISGKISAQCTYLENNEN